MDIVDLPKLRWSVHHTRSSRQRKRRAEPARTLSRAFCQNKESNLRFDHRSCACARRL